MYRSDRVCWMCGRNGCAEPLEKHHIFNGTGLRKKSERYGLTVYLCAQSCHNGGPESVHRSQARDEELKRWGQEKAMEENGWTVADFIREFGKNYLGESSECKVKSSNKGGFAVTDLVLPF